ncbi:hypothetical protein HGA15_28915 [Nocardia flavorosea]|uniref:Uncharacterized protein n=3 Tax=Nocardia flavorosea TaxID=53429 RepID=A0A846YMR3_9NOCA|nr:hypothetical protein [Nocardia flavorosea]
MTGCSSGAAVSWDESGRASETSASAAPPPPPHMANLLPGMPPPLRFDDIYADNRELSPAVAEHRELVYVPNSRSHDVSVIDPATFQVIDTFSAGGVEPQHVVPLLHRAHGGHAIAEAACPARAARVGGKRQCRHRAAAAARNRGNRSARRIGAIADRPGLLGRRGSGDGPVGADAVDHVRCLFTRVNAPPGCHTSCRLRGKRAACRTARQHGPPTVARDAHQHSADSLCTAHTGMRNRAAEVRHGRL